MEEKIKQFCEYIKESNNIVFFGGAGVSTESGIPDFRSENGLYNKQKEEFKKFSPEYYLSHDCLVEHPKAFFEFVRCFMDSRSYEPNITHIILAKLEKIGKLKAVVTQNIDGLHQKAGSKNVIEIHGNAELSHCENCGKSYCKNYIYDSNETIPICQCGGIVRPDITLYGEALNQENMLNAIIEIGKADMLIIAGTSLTVQPAANLVSFFSGKYIVVINKNWF